MILAPRPYRPNVGIALFNAEGLVMIARRLKDDRPEIILRVIYRRVATEFGHIAASPSRRSLAGSALNA